MKDRILLIDDEEIIRRRLKKLLKLDGYEVFTAENGQQGLDIFQKMKDEKRDVIKVVLLDIKMPGMDGIEVLKKIKESVSQTEVIMITGHGAIDSAIQALRMGAFDYITKPIEYDELTLSISRALEKQGMQRKLDGYLKKLEQTTTHLETILDTVPAGLAVIDRDLRAKSANRSFYETFQIEPKKVIGSGLCDIFQDKDGKLSSELSKLFGTEDTLKDFEMPYQLEKLDERVLDITARGITDAEVLVVIRDTTERKRMEEKLKEKISDLEKFHKFAVGRELKMIELKNRIKELEGEISHSL